MFFSVLLLTIFSFPLFAGGEGRAVARNTGGSGVAAGVAAKTLGFIAKEAIEAKPIDKFVPSTQDPFHLPDFGVERKDHKLKRRYSITLLGLSGSGASCYRYDVSKCGMYFILKYTMPHTIANISFLMDSFKDTFDSTSARVTGLQQAINDAPSIDTTGGQKETGLGPGSVMRYPIPFCIASKAVGYNGMQGVMIEDRALIDDEGIEKIVTLWYYNFVAVNDAEDNIFVDATKNVSDMFCYATWMQVDPGPQSRPVDAFYPRAQHADSASACRHPTNHNDDTENSAL